MSLIYCRWAVPESVVFGVKDCRGRKIVTDVVFNTDDWFDLERGILKRKDCVQAIKSEECPNIFKYSNRLNRTFTLMLLASELG